jgi:hypothetical protein
MRRLVVLLLFLPAFAEEADVEALVRKAMEAYRAGRKHDAVDLLTKAANLIQKEGERGLVAFLPAAPEGWRREEVQSSSGTWGSGESAFQWTQVDVEYVRGEEEEQVRVKVSISSSPVVVQAQKPMVDMLRNEQYLAMVNQDPDRKMKVFTKDGWNGFTVVEKEGSASLTALTEKLVCNIEAPSGDARLLGQFIGLLDWRGLGESVR